MRRLAIEEPIYGSGAPQDSRHSVHWAEASTRTRSFWRSVLPSGLHRLRSLPIGSVPVRRPGNFMSNRAIWNVRLRHVWLATPLKGKRLKRRQRLRIGLEEALVRKGKNAAAEPSAPETNS